MKSFTYRGGQRTFRTAKSADMPNELGQAAA